MSTAPREYRVLVIDDTPAIHNDYRKVLCLAAQGAGIAQMEALLFGNADDGASAASTPAHAAAAAPAQPGVVRFVLDSAFQGLEGLEKLQSALRQNRPYAMAFV